MAKKNRRWMSYVQRRDSGQGDVVARWGSASVEGDAPVLQLSLATLHAVGRHQFPVPAVAAGHRFFQMAANAKGEVAQAAATFHQ